MISINKRFMYGEVYNDVRCLSVDEKPVDDIKNGSILVEIDTGTTYMFDATEKVWNEMPSGGGGGGGGGGGVESFNGRQGAVRSRAGDYTATQINTSTAGKTVQAALNDLEPDAALSSTSTHPVQNKVIKAKLDEIETSTQVDPTLSPTSQKPVRNSAITAKFTEHEGKLVPAGGVAGAVLAKSTGSDHALEWKSPDEWMLKEDYDSDDDGIVDEAELAGSVKTGLHVATAADKGRDVTIMTDADKGIANGIVPLDSGRKILPEYLPDSIMAGLTYGGVFNATTRVVELTPAAKSILDVTDDTMTLENTDQIPEGYPANAELFYITTTAGTFAGMTFSSGDWLSALSTGWKQLQNGNPVSSVHTQTGAVVLDADDISQGIVNLYMRTTERAKLENIEARATRDVNVIQSAAILTDTDGNDYLHLLNKNGAETDFYGGSVDLSEYLKVDGNASDVYAPYTAASTRQPFSGSETLADFASKVSGWLQAIEEVAFTSDYDDLDDKPTYNGVTLEGNLIATDLGTLDVEEVTELPAMPVSNTLYIYHTTKRGRPYTRYLTYTTDWNEIETGGFEVIGVDDDPTETPPTADALYVHRWTDAGGTNRVQVGIMLDGSYQRIALYSDILTDYDELTGKPSIDTHEVVSGNQRHESLGLVGVGDFVTTPTGKTDGIEFVLGEGTPSAPAVITEINDSAEMKYSTVHTSSNHYINAMFDAINNSIASKLNMLIVEELPDPVTRNTMYYVETSTAGVYDIVLVDAVGTQASMGTTALDLSGVVRETRTVAGIALDADISAAQIANATKGEAATLTNKSIDADNNSITDLTTANMKGTALATSIGGTPTNSKLVTEKAVSDYAVAKTIGVNKVYGTGSSGAALEYTVTNTYTSTANDQLLSRAGANNMYRTLKNCENHESQDVAITMTALENDFAYSRKNYARRIANNVYAICFELYRSAVSAAGEEVRVNSGKNFKVNGANVAAVALSAVSVYDSSAIGCTYSNSSLTLNPTNEVGSGNAYLIRVSGIVYTV